jgi:hypothetical protein
MPKRTRVNRGRDRKIFKNTATIQKRMNIAPKVQRGGIRL